MNINYVVMGIGVLAAMAIFEERSGMLKEGDVAPNFTARLTTGETM